MPLPAAGCPSQACCVPLPAARWRWFIPTTCPAIGLLPHLSGARLDVRTDSSIGRGMVIVDAPDFDSVESSNRDLALELMEAADLVIFVTTVTRYADQVPWDILARARQRGFR